MSLHPHTPQTSTCSGKPLIKVVVDYNCIASQIPIGCTQKDSRRITINIRSCRFCARGSRLGASFPIGRLCTSERVLPIAPSPGKSVTWSDVAASNVPSLVSRYTRNCSLLRISFLFCFLFLAFSGAFSSSLSFCSPLSGEKELLLQQSYPIRSLDQKSVPNWSRSFNVQFYLVIV